MLGRRVLLSGLAACACLVSAALAQPTSIKLPADSAIDIRLEEALSSKTAHQGDTFHFSLTAPVVRDGITLLPAGTQGVGEVIDAKPGGMGGRPGVLVVAARFVNYQDVHVPVGHFHWGGAGQAATAQAGQNRVETAMVVGMATGVGGLLVNGGNVSAAAGALANVRTTEDVDLPAPATTPITTAAPPPGDTKP